MLQFLKRQEPPSLKWPSTQPRPPPRRRATVRSSSTEPLGPPKRGVRIVSPQPQSSTLFRKKRAINVGSGWVGGGRKCVDGGSGGLEELVGRPVVVGVWVCGRRVSHPAPRFSTVTAGRQERGKKNAAASVQPTQPHAHPSTAHRPRRSHNRLTQQKERPAASHLALRSAEKRRRRTTPASNEGAGSKSPLLPQVFHTQKTA
jgi:hypothetical protein